MRDRVNFEFINVWKNLPDSIIGIIDKIWIEHGNLLDESERKRRLDEIIFLIKADGEIVGVSTAHKTYVSQLNNSFYAFRCLIVPSFRTAGLDAKLLAETIKFLQSIHIQDVEDEPKGIIMVIQNDFINENWRQAVWPGVDMMYIGETSRGEHVRVHYFKGAKI